MRLFTALYQTMFMLKGSGAVEVGGARGRDCRQMTAGEVGSSNVCSVREARVGGRGLSLAVRTATLRPRLTCDRLETAAAAHSGEQGLTKTCALMLGGWGGRAARPGDALSAEECAVAAQCDEVDASASIISGAVVAVLSVRVASV
jgi:hypothetical protein